MAQTPSSGRFIFLEVPYVNDDRLDFKPCIAAVRRAVRGQPRDPFHGTYGGQLQGYDSYSWGKFPSGKGTGNRSRVAGPFMLGADRAEPSSPPSRCKAIDEPIRPASSGKQPCRDLLQRNTRTHCGFFVRARKTPSSTATERVNRVAIFPPDRAT